MTIIEPHIHMLSRTTDEYQAMYAAGIRACVEPSFWLGANRRYAGSFFDYFRLILEFETVRAARFGIDHFSAIAMNPKEAEDRALADEVIDGLAPYLDHPRCVAMGEIGLNLNTPNEEHALIRQLRMAEERKMPVILHTPLMSGTNAIHGIVVLGALLVLGNLPADAGWGVRIIAFVALVFGTLNVIGGFLVTDRMLGMFKGRKPEVEKAEAKK